MLFSAVVKEHYMAFYRLSVWRSVFNEAFFRMNHLSGSYPTSFSCQSIFNFMPVYSQMHASAYKTPCMLLNGWSLSACICPVIITGDNGLTVWKMCQIDITGRGWRRIPIFDTLREFIFFSTTFCLTTFLPVRRKVSGRGKPRRYCRRRPLLP